MPLLNFDSHPTISHFSFAFAYYQIAMIVLHISKTALSLVLEDVSLA